MVIRFEHEYELPLQFLYIKGMHQMMGYKGNTQQIASLGQLHQKLNLLLLLKVKLHRTKIKHCDAHIEKLIILRKSCDLKHSQI